MMRTERLRLALRVSSFAGIVLIAALVASPSPTSASSYQTPQIFRLNATVPLFPEIHTVCLVRAEEPSPTPTPAPVSTRAVCYSTVGSEPPPPPPPPPLQALIPLFYHQLAEGERSGGQLTLHTQPCIGVADIFALRVTLLIPLSKSGATVSGDYVFLRWDTTAPFNCEDGTVTTGPLTLTPLASDHNEDSAESLAVLGHPDPCTDFQELSVNVGTGGRRDPFNPYDFFDANGDTAITNVDMFAVFAKFGSTSGAGPPYEASHDRGGLVPDADGIDDPDNFWDGPGPSAWNQKAPDGAIAIPDIFAVAAQFGHAC
jgi:hypothetical protein